MKIDELKHTVYPLDWGLIEVDTNGKAMCVYNPFGKGNIYHNWERFEKNKNAEKAVLYSALRRMESNKVLQNNL